MKNMYPDSLGKIPPQAIDMEEAVLGAILLDSEAVINVMGILKAEHFYKEANRTIFEAIASLFNKRNPVDTLTVSEELRAKNKLDEVGGPIYLANITTVIVSAANSESHALIVKEKYILRQYLGFAAEISNMVYENTELSLVMDRASAFIMEIANEGNRSDYRQIGEIIDGVIVQIQKIQSREIVLAGVPSGFVELDRGTGGWKSGELEIVAARPSVGKTALALQMALNAATYGTNAGFFSMEMSAEEIGRRYLSGCSGMSNIQLMTGECMGVEALINMTAKFASMGLYIDDTPALSLTEIKAKARKMMIKHDVKIFFVDYLQLMRGQRKEREQEVSELSRGLKAIARDLKVPFVVLSQLNRKCEERADKKPLLSDLRDSGAIEQDADIVLLLSSPKRNGFQNVDIPDVGEVDSRGLLLVNIAKNRNGGTGDIYLKHNDSMTIIEDFESGNFDDDKF
jgi:replicative DNA helicase